MQEVNNEDGLPRFDRNSYLDEDQIKVGVSEICLIIYRVSPVTLGFSSEIFGNNMNKHLFETPTFLIRAFLAT